MNKFSTALAANAEGIKQARAILIAKEVKSEQEKLVKTLEDRMNKLELERLNLCDVSPENAMSTKATKDGFNSEQWVKRMQEIKCDLFIAERELKFAKETLAEWFDDSGVTTKE